MLRILYSTTCLPARLKALRQQYKLPTSFLAEYLDVSLRAYQFYESGKRTPLLRDLVMLADFYSISTDELIGREWPPSKPIPTPDKWVYDAMSQD